MTNNFKEELEKEIRGFLELNAEKHHIVVKQDTVNDSEIAIQIKPASQSSSGESGHFIIKAIILDNYREVHITNLLCSGVFRGKGMAKKLIKSVYDKGKEYDYETYLVNLVPSFFDSMRRRKAKVVNKEILKITDETDLISIRKTPKPYSAEIAMCKNVKEEFLPYLPVHSNAISFIKWKQKQIEYILSDFKFKKIRNIMKEDNNNLLIPIFNLDYIVDTYFNADDPYSLDKEICEQFYFFIWKTNPVIELLNETGTGYTLIDKHENEVCTLNLGEYCKYKPIYFKDIDELNRKMSNELNSDILNILVWAKKKNKVIFHAIEQKPLR